MGSQSVSQGAETAAKKAEFVESDELNQVIHPADVGKRRTVSVQFSSPFFATLNQSLAVRGFH